MASGGTLYHFGRDGRGRLPELGAARRQPSTLPTSPLCRTTRIARWWRRIPVGTGTTGSDTAADPPVAGYSYAPGRGLHRDRPGAPRPLPEQRRHAHLPRRPRRDRVGHLRHGHAGAGEIPYDPPLEHTRSLERHEHRGNTTSSVTGPPTRSGPRATSSTSSPARAWWAASPIWSVLCNPGLLRVRPLSTVYGSFGSS